jgi:hypothetical protein
MRFLPALVLGFTMFSAAAQAEEPAACKGQSAILALSDAVLTGRDKLPRLKARDFGAEAAYLKIRYGKLSMEDAAGLAHGLRDAGVREAIDLAGAIDAARGGYDALKVSDPVQLNGLISTLRATLQAGDGEKLFAAIAGLPPARQTSLLGSIVPAIVDWPDAEKGKLAASAGRHRLFFVQAGLGASQRDANAWPVFVAGFADQSMIPDLTRMWNWAPALVGRPALPRIPLPDVETQAGQKSLHTVTVAAAQEPERDFLMTYLNQTGSIAPAEKAAQAVLAEIAAHGLQGPTGKRGRPDRGRQHARQHRRPYARGGRRFGPRRDRPGDRHRYAYALPHRQERRFARDAQRHQRKVPGQMAVVGGACRSAQILATRPLRE